MVNVTQAVKQVKFSSNKPIRANQFLMKIVGISGGAGTGKDFLLSQLFIPMLTRGKPYAMMAFADHSKMECIVTKGLDRTKVFGRKDIETRKILQIRGTEEGRDIYGGDFWVRILGERMIQYQARGIEYFFITDVRFPEEIAFVRSQGGVVIKIHAPDRYLEAMRIENGNDPSVVQHRSETSVKEEKFDFVINNRLTDTDVADQVREIVLILRERWKYDCTVFCDLDDTLVECNRHYREIIDKVLDKILIAYPHLDRNFLRSKFLAEEHLIGELFFSREAFATSLSKLVPPDAIAFTREIFALGMNVHQSEFNLLPGAKENLFTLNKKFHLVITTVGDPVDQVRKLFKNGLYGFKLECTSKKDVGFFRNMIEKYPSKHYAVIGDSIHADILPAVKAGVLDIHHIENHNFGQLRFE